MPVEFKALAKTPGRCAMKGCRMEGKKIYQSPTLRILACTEGHAKAVASKLAVPPPGVPEETYQRLLTGALAVFNDPGRVAAAPEPAEADYDIPF